MSIIYFGRPSLRWLRYLFVAAILFFLTTRPATANIPMFWVLAGVRVTYWWTIILALLIETIVLRDYFDFSWLRSVSAATTVNFITFLAGIGLYPLLEGIGIGTVAVGPVVGLGAILLVVAVLDTIVELTFLFILFNALISWTNGSIFLVANILSSAVLFFAIFVLSH